MKTFIILFATFAFLPFRLSAQQANGLIVKSELFRNLNTNYNLGFEKILTKRFSAGLEGIWVRREAAATGGEGPVGIRTFPYQHNSNGYRVELFGRYYFGKKHQAPNAFFASPFLRYNATRINGLDMQKGISGLYVRTIDLIRKGPELGIATGRQFYLFRNITAEINVGISNYFTSVEEIFVGGETSSDYVNGKYKYRENQLRGQFQFKIGYLFGMR
jgi:hypothetical protein